MLPARTKTGQPSKTARRHALLVPLTLLLGTAVVSGCSVSHSAGKTMSGWFGGGSEAAKPKEKVYYVTVEGLDVRAEPKTSSKVLGRLRLREKVVRTKEKGGYSFVRARDGSLEGWVLNAKLDWRVPDTTGGAKTEAAPAAEGSPTDAASPVAGDESVDATVGQTAAEVAPIEQEPEAAKPAPAASEPPPSGPAAPASKKRAMGASVLDPY